MRLQALSIPLLLSLLSSSTAYTQISDDLLKTLIPNPSDTDFDLSPSNADSLLGPLLITRVPGTPGQRAAQEHFTRFATKHIPEWKLSWQNSSSPTPLSKGNPVPFHNIILRREPPWARKRGEGNVGLLTLAAHYDSKMIQGGDFIGATDSAAPCAVLMWVARELEKVLGRLWGDGEDGTGEGVQILLLDGEEAFVSWTDTDSLYGSRALAAAWENTTYPALSTFRNPLRQISLFVLLDLLGSPNPNVPSYFQTTHWAYQRMATLEGRLRGLGLLESKPMHPFLPDGAKMATEFTRAFIGDDHEPFMKRGAPVLHLIPSPFPEVWHRLEDDGAHLDMATVRDWARITLAFVLEWLDAGKLEKIQT